MACRLFGAKPLSEPMQLMLLIGHVGTKFNEISTKIHILSFKKIHFKMSSKWWPFCLGLIVLTQLNVWAMKAVTLVITWKPISSMKISHLTHWGQVTHICVGNLTFIGSDNGLSPDRHQAIIWTNAGILLIGPLGTNFSEILIEILTYSFKKIRLNVSSVKWRPFCRGLNVLEKSWKAGHIYYWFK